MLLAKVKDIHESWFATTDKALTIVTRLLFQRCEIEPYAKVQMLARMAYIGFGNNDIGCVIKSHATFRTPFLCIKSIKSSTMYSREKVCNTS